MSDYYEPHARLSLSRPLVIGGQLGCGARLIGRSLCARTGLAIVDIDRKIEHDAGRSLAHIAHDEGPVRIGTWSLEILERLTLEQHCSVIVLDHAWPAAEAHSLLRLRCNFVHVERDVRFLFERAVREMRGRASWIPRGLGADLQNEFKTPRDLESLFAQRAPLLRSAGTVLAAGSLHPTRAAEILLESLEPWTSAHLA